MQLISIDEYAPGNLFLTRREDGLSQRGWTSENKGGRERKKFKNVGGTCIFCLTFLSFSLIFSLCAVASKQFQRSLLFSTNDNL